MALLAALALAVVFVLPAPFAGQVAVEGGCALRAPTLCALACDVARALPALAELQVGAGWIALACGDAAQAA